MLPYSNFRLSSSTYLRIIASRQPYLPHIYFVTGILRQARFPLLHDAMHCLYVFLYIFLSIPDHCVISPTPGLLYPE